MGRLGPGIISSDDTTTPAEIASTVLDAAEVVEAGTGVVNVWNNGADPSGGADSTDAVLAAIAELSTTGGIVYFPNGVYTLSDTLAVPSSVRLVGAGLGYSGAVGTVLDFSGMSGSDPIITFADVDGGSLKWMRIAGRSAGATGDAIRFTGTNHQCVFDHLVVTDASSDGACFGSQHTASDFSTLCQFRNVRTGNAAYGWRVGSGGNFVAATFIGCYANGHTVDGYSGRFDQSTFHTCYAESNTAYGWNFDGGINAKILGGSAENNGKSAIRVNNFYGFTVNGLYAANNGSASYPSILESSNGCLNLQVDNVDEASAGAGVVYSIANTAGTAPTGSLRDNRFQAALDATWTALPRFQSGGVYIGGKIHYYSTAAPTAGTWVVGDIVWNTLPSANLVIGWQCIAAGTPGTWVEMGVGDIRVYRGTSAPGTGTWAVSDVIFNSAPAAGQPAGWMCSAAGTPGTWVAMGNLA